MKKKEPVGDSDSLEDSLISGLAGRIRLLYKENGPVGNSDSLDDCSGLTVPL